MGRPDRHPNKGHERGWRFRRKSSIKPYVYVRVTVGPFIAVTVKLPVRVGRADKAEKNTQYRRNSVRFQFSALESRVNGGKQECGGRTSYTFIRIRFCLRAINGYDFTAASIFLHHTHTHTHDPANRTEKERNGRGPRGKSDTSRTGVRAVFLTS